MKTLYRFYAAYYRAEASRERADFYEANPEYFGEIGMRKIQGISEIVGDFEKSKSPYRVFDFYGQAISISL